MLRKGSYPYQYFTDMSKFADTELPPACYFKSVDDWMHAENVWREFDMHTLGDYHDVYLKSDVCLLTDVFENFRVFAMEQYGLDPIHYLTLPSFAWDACLKYTGVELDLMSDENMYLFFENSIRGGIAVASKRYACANNPLIESMYDPTKPTSWITYLDANN